MQESSINSLIFVGVFLVATLLVLWLIPVKLWLAARVSGASISMHSLIGMRLRRVPALLICSAYIAAVKAGLHVSLDDLEAHFLSGGDVSRVIATLIAKQKAGETVEFETAAADDLSGSV